MSSGNWADYYPVALAILFYFALLASGMVAARRAVAKREEGSGRGALPYL